MTIDSSNETECSVAKQSWRFWETRTKQVTSHIWVWLHYRESVDNKSPKRLKLSQILYTIDSLSQLYK